MALSPETTTRFSVFSADDDETALVNERVPIQLKKPFIGEGHLGGRSKDLLQAFQMNGRVFWLEKDIGKKFWSPWKNIYLCTRHNPDIL